MTEAGYLLLALTAIVGALAGLLMFAVLRFGAVAREMSRRVRPADTETAFLATTLQEAVTRLRDQERASQARADASERLSSQIISSLASGLLVVGVDGAVSILNPAGRRLLELPDGGEGRSFHEVLGAPATPLADVIDECLAAGRPIMRRTIERRPSGTRGGGASHLGVTVSPIFGNDAALRGAICLFSDLTAVVELEEQVRLKDSLARLGELTAGMAHEFRNGLATIHGYARLLDPDSLAPSSRPYVLGIRQETEALEQIVTQFLNFARPTKLTLTPVDLRGLAERVADEIRPEVQARGGEVRVEGEFGVVEGDEVLLRQAFSNLCRNALEACSEAEIRPVIVLGGAVEPRQRLARVTVSDNGPGIDPAARDRIFRPFFTTRARGSGLGLALVQKIVVTHNGRVMAGHAEGGGARIQVTLPMATGPEPQNRYEM